MLARLPMYTLGVVASCASTVAYVLDHLFPSSKQVGLEVHRMEQHLSLSVREDAHRLAVDRKTPQESGAALKKRNGVDHMASPGLDQPRPGPPQPSPAWPHTGPAWPQPGHVASNHEVFGLGNIYGWRNVSFRSNRCVRKKCPSPHKSNSCLPQH